jgi:hypothetical protein
MIAVEVSRGQGDGREKCRPYLQVVAVEKALLADQALHLLLQETSLHRAVALVVREEAAELLPAVALAPLDDRRRRTGVVAVVAAEPPGQLGRGVRPRGPTWSMRVHFDPFLSNGVADVLEVRRLRSELLQRHLQLAHLLRSNGTNVARVVDSRLAECRGVEVAIPGFHGVEPLLHCHYSCRYSSNRR